MIPLISTSEEIWELDPNDELNIDELQPMLLMEKILCFHEQFDKVNPLV